MSFLGTIMYDTAGSGFSRHANFESMGRAFACLIRMASADSWAPFLAEAVHNPHVRGVEAPPSGVIYLYFLLYMGFMQWILVMHLNDIRVWWGIWVWTMAR